MLSKKGSLVTRLGCFLSFFLLRRTLLLAMHRPEVPTIDIDSFRWCTFSEVSSSFSSPCQFSASALTSHTLLMKNSISSLISYPDPAITIHDRSVHTVSRIVVVLHVKWQNRSWHPLLEWPFQKGRGLTRVLHWQRRMRHKGRDCTGRDTTWTETQGLQL